MHRDVGRIRQHALFQLLDEQALATDPRQRAVEYLVPFGRHGHQLDMHARVGFAEAGGDMLGLPQCQGTFSGCDADNGHYEINSLSLQFVPKSPLSLRERVRVRGSKR